MTTTNTPRCDVCGGELIGAELDWTTCGHCGGRSIDPRIGSDHWSYDFETGGLTRRWSRGRITPTEAIAAAFVGGTLTLCVALGLFLAWAIGWVAALVAGFVGGWVNFCLIILAGGALGGVVYAFAFPEVLDR